MRSIGNNFFTEFVKQIAASKACSHLRGQDSLLQHRRTTDQGFFGKISLRRGQRPILSDIDRKQGEHLGDIDALIELVRCNLTLVPVDQPHLGGLIHNQ